MIQGPKQDAASETISAKKVLRSSPWAHLKSFARFGEMQINCERELWHVWHKISEKSSNIVLLGEIPRLLGVDSITRFPMCLARLRSSRSPSLRQLFAGLLRHHVRGVPIRPVLVALAAGAGFVLAVRLRCAAHRVRQIFRRSEGRRCGVNAARQPRRQLLKQPAVAVRVFE